MNIAEEEEEDREYALQEEQRRANIKKLMRLLIEVAILAVTALVLWIVLHGLLHGLLDPTWKGQEVLIAALVVGWLSVRYYRRRRARLRRRLSPRQWQ